MNKKYKVLFLETHYNGDITHGVDFARIVNPARALMEHPDFEVEIRKDPTEGTAQKNWDEVTQYFDLIVCSYMDNPSGFVHLGLYCQKNRTPFIIDCDDDLWEIPHFSPTYKFFHPGSEKLNVVSLAMEEAPYIITTNMFLKRKMVELLGKQYNQIKVLPNWIDLNLYDYKKIPEKKNDDRILISYYGTNTHTVDVLEHNFVTGLKRVLAENPNVYFETTGFFLPQLKTNFKRQYLFRNGVANFFKWVDLWGEIMSPTDIVVAPLQNIDFNKCKSNIKFLEYSAAKKPGVYQDIRQYQEMVNEGKTGFLASSEWSWYEKLSKLVRDARLRKEIGENAYNFVKEKHTIQKNIGQYAEYLKNVIEEHKGTANLKQAGFILPGQEVIY